MELMWHAVGELPQVKQVIAVFSILSVQLYKGDDMAKVETKLKRPVKVVQEINVVVN